MDRLRLSKVRGWTPQKIGFCMISVVVIWGMYLLSQTHLKYKRNISETDYLKTEIIKLSKQYIHALAQEKNKQHDIGSSSNQQTAVLLNNMLDRIESLEDQLHNVIVNSTDSFAKMDKVIRVLNITIHREWNLTESGGKIHCEIPNDVGYPHCSEKVEWLNKNWKTNEKYARNGVNGSTCSFLYYLSNVEDHCPKSFSITHRDTIPSVPIVNELEDSTCLAKSQDAAFPSCKQKIDWMTKFWTSDPLYSSHGVDGSVCSIVKFLSEVESWCALLDGRKAEKQLCEIPKVPEFPHCGEKVSWMKKFWTSDPCYMKMGVNGSVCSFIIYLGEVESWCPLLPGRSAWKFDDVIQSKPTELPNISQTNLDKLLEIIQAKQVKIKVEWIVQRITRLWPDWLRGHRKLSNRVKLDSYPRKKILIYIGLLADETNYHFAEQATKGGPLGELVQWSDLIVALYLLGHDITLSLTKAGSVSNSMSSLLKSSISGLCPNQLRGVYDIIYTDYIGLSHIIRKFKNVQSIKCHLRIVDSFGTEAQFNHKIDNTMKNLYGFHNLDLKQYNTMFPHSPDNTYLGFIVENHFLNQEPIKKKPIALVYGKHISMWEDHKKIAFLDIVQQHFEVHATVGGPKGEKGKISYVIPKYVTNHGVLKGGEYQKLLREATLFVGLGFPYEGPAPLEAIANGCFFLNAKLVPPLGRSNNKFFKQKPTERKLTSQHPYAEKFIGKPYVYTVNLQDKAAVEKALDEMEDKTVEPYLPFEFTYEGMLERLYAFTKHHDFCNNHGQSNNTWPPLSAKKVLLGEVDQGCDEVCSKKDMVCEPAYFASINKKESLPDYCVVSTKASLVAPAVMVTNECMIQANALFYSCTTKSPSTKRLCPCRDFVRGQTALCKDCLR